MSVFSKIKSAKKAAKEHKVAENNTATESPPAKVPYKHVPTHAAFDALSGAPSSWKHEDRPKIQQHNKRRSEMASIAHSESSTALPSRKTTPAISTLIRNSSYNSYNPTWNDRGDQNFLQDAVSTPSSRRQTRNSSYVGTPTNGPSRFTNQENWPISSSESTSSNSSSSSQRLEIAHSPAQHKFGDKDIFTRLHTSTNRKIGEAPMANFPQYPVPAVVAKSKQPEAISVEIRRPKRSVFGLPKKTEGTAILV